jgi:hypothetical protein
VISWLRAFAFHAGQLVCRYVEIKEEEFHLAQARMRSDMRVKGGRARAIDLLARNLNAEPGWGCVHVECSYDPPERLQARLVRW